MVINLEMQALIKDLLTTDGMVYLQFFKQDKHRVVSIVGYMEMFDVVTLHPLRLNYLYEQSMKGDFYGNVIETKILKEYILKS